LVGEAYHGGDFMTLKERAVEQGVASEDWFRNVFRQCFEALVFMHEQAMMHCDIKEPNLMLREKSFRNPRVVVIDLGVCACMATSDNGMPHGTPGYVPPETLKTRKWFPRGDVFSLGVSICQIMCDKLPPTGARDRNTPGGIFIEGCINVREIFQATIQRVPPLHLMPEEYPLLTPLVEKLLDKTHENRPSAPMVLNETWFKTGRDGESTWRFADKFDKYNARSRFASVGITNAFLMDQSEELEMGAVNSVAMKNLKALREATEIISPNNRSATSNSPKD
jgi:serine/threonine protein kinase